MDQEPEINVEEDFYNANEYDEEDSYHANEIEDEGLPQDEKVTSGTTEIPQDLVFNNPELDEFRTTLLQKVNSKPSNQQLETNSYFDFKLSAFYRRLQNIPGESVSRFSTMSSLLEFVKHFKNCNPDERELREAGLTAYTQQIKESMRYVNSFYGPGEFEACEYEDLITLLEEACAWRYANPTTNFPDVNEREVEIDLLDIEEQIKDSYCTLIKINLGLAIQEIEPLQSLQKRLNGILAGLLYLKISPGWHKRVYKRFHMRREINKLIKEASSVHDNKQKLINENHQNYDGAVSGEFANKTQEKKLELAHLKSAIKINGSMHNAQDNFEVPSHLIIEGTYFDSKLKSINSELEALELKYGRKDVFKILFELVQVLNLSFNTVQNPKDFVYGVEEFLHLVKVEESSIVTANNINNNFLFDILILLESFSSLMDEIVRWKQEYQTTNGDVQDDEVTKDFDKCQKVLHEAQILITQNKSYKQYVDGTTYTNLIKSLQLKLTSLLDLQLSITNTYCLERIDYVIKNTEISIEELIRMQESLQINFKSLASTFAISMRFALNMKDFDLRFTGKMTGSHRKQLKEWEKQLRQANLI